jgi:DNA polymerase kappa
MERTGMSAGEVVSQLRAGVEEKTGLTISAGIAPNKMLAKVSLEHRP